MAKRTPAENIHPAPGAAGLVDALADVSFRECYDQKAFAAHPCVKAVLDADLDAQTAVVRETIDRLARLRDSVGDPEVNAQRYANLHHEPGYPFAAVQLVRRLLRRKLPISEADLAQWIDRIAHLERLSTWCVPFLSNLVDLADKRAEAVGGIVPAVLREPLARFAQATAWCGNAAEHKLRGRIQILLGGASALPIEAGEAWSDRAIADIESMSEALRRQWTALLTHCAGASGAAPGAAWVASAKQKLAALGDAEFAARVARWFPLVDKPRTCPIEVHDEEVRDIANRMIIDPHMDLLKGLAWCGGLTNLPDVARAIGRLAVSAYRKVPKVGPRAVKVGNACVTALGMMPGEHAVAQLAVLRAGVKFGTAQKTIDKAYNAAAARSGVSRGDLEEMGVPTYGLDDQGVRREQLGDATAELRVSGSDVGLQWFNAAGKPVKSVPASVRTGHPDELKDLKAVVKDVEQMLPAQRDRLDGLFVADKRWPLDVWRSRYLDHPLIGTIARRLIWTFRDGNAKPSAIWHDGQLVGPDDAPVDAATGGEVRLWHPIGRPMDDVLAWRAWLTRREVRQPFKQAHREVYLLTDAERRTHTYSNRFAAHVIRQHQFNALCAARGWRHKLRLMVDDVYPPATKDLPAFGLRAEYWVEGIGDGYGTDTAESGAYLRLGTDQVRFYRMGAAENRAHAGGGGYETDALGRGAGGINEPLPLEQVPPLAFSEVMRDVDLFVGVASVGNDPTWQDGGPEGRYRTYWHSYSFGDLSATAQTRRQVLEGLLPRLKIRDRATLSERFLVVRGNVRTYKIHLGSGNILMEPTDQYLCIVPAQGAAAAAGRGGGAGDVFLPFEGDSVLSIILSKALLLADDDKIKDPTITRQIKPA